jgi:hypothetical protein
MEIDRRQLLLPALAVGIAGVVPALAAEPDEEQVAKAVEAFRLAQIKADAKTLDALCATELSHSHGDAGPEDKATFIAKSTHGKYKYLSLEYRDPQIRVVGRPRSCGFTLSAKLSGSPTARKATLISMF